MSKITPITADIDAIEAELDRAPEPGIDVIFLPLPIPTYKAISDAAARKNMTAAQLLAKAITIAVKED